MKIGMAVVCREHLPKGGYRLVSQSRVLEFTGMVIEPESFQIAIPERDPYPIVNMTFEGAAISQRFAPRAYVGERPGPPPPAKSRRPATR